MSFKLPGTGAVTAVVKGVGKVLDATLGVLPVAWQRKVREARKAVVGGAGTLLSVLAALSVIPLPENIAPWVALVSAVATGVVTYWVPNEAE